MAAISEDGPVTGARKAAIAMILFGPALSGKLVQHLTEREATTLAKEISRIGVIEPETAEEILREYFDSAMQPQKDEGGSEFARKFLTAAAFPEQTMDRMLGSRNDPLRKTLASLLEKSPSTLAGALQEEHPQTAALVLLQLPAARASRILRTLPEDKQSETVLRMATLRQVSGEMVGEVAASLHERLASEEPAGEEEEEESGFEKTAGVLKKLPRMEIRRLLEELEADHPEEVEALRGQLFTFESLAQADDKGLQELLRQVDSAKVALALHGAGERISERLLGNLSERAASMLKEEIEYLGNVKPEDKEEARKGLVDIALKLENDGTLTFEEEEG